MAGQYFLSHKRILAPSKHASVAQVGSLFGGGGNSEFPVVQGSDAHPGAVGRLVPVLLNCVSNSGWLNGAFCGNRRLVPVPSTYVEIVYAPRTTSFPFILLGVQANPIRGWNDNPP